ncbi:DNA-binding response regulator, NarL/FixJ family, contains REC and HTH domains [Filimonas lacunae]|uniref:DNA-binding response regulator, NarL/FixJ family, contains REC and HTH domains n=1 Tax=Filimonas lacunae TaxID=477680 RepID=A0A173MKI2_9BACT|nr:response regulator transcription factor [Filimonas lacunae]BAV08000.1 DNA-binding response regulator, LuxR family [Filimonas lacunae]SIT07732.1 DNA-binding response regulator, NarL/FixJ family, contains REC and HTH domains [Filimonas lacunae]
MIYIGIVEKNESFVLAIKTFLLDRADCSIVFECATIEEYYQLNDTIKIADVVFVSVAEEAHALIMAAGIRKQYNFMQVVFMLSSNDERLVLKAIKAGVTGFLKKPFSQKALEDCLGNIYEGKSYLAFDIQRKVFDMLYQEQLQSGRKIGTHILTAREADIIKLILKGNTNKEIGEALFISHHTVNEHLKRIFRKLNVNSRIKLIYKVVADFNLYD